MILSLNGFDDSRIAVDYSRLNFLDCEKTKSQNVQNLFTDRSGHYSTGGKLKYLSVH